MIGCQHPAFYGVRRAKTIGFTPIWHPWIKWAIGYPAVVGAISVPAHALKALGQARLFEAKSLSFKVLRQFPPTLELAVTLDLLQFHVISLFHAR